MDVKLRAGHPINAPIACPQCHASYQVHDRWALPGPLLAILNATIRTTDRLLMYAALAGLCGAGYGGLFGYGTAVFGAAVGPSTAFSFFHTHLGAIRAESIVKVFLGMPLVAVSVLAGAFPSLSWAFPLIPPVLYANDVIQWTIPSAKLLALALPFGLFLYRLGEIQVPRLILSILGRSEDSAPESSSSGSSPVMMTGGDESMLTVTTAATTTTNTSTATNTTAVLEDERAIRVSVLSTTGVLCLPFAAALLGALLFRHRLSLPFYRMLAGGALLIAAKDIIRGLVWYQQVVIRPYRRILDYKADAKTLG